MTRLQLYPNLHFPNQFFHEKYLPIVNIDKSAEEIIITANSNENSLFHYYVSNFKKKKKKYKYHKYRLTPAIVTTGRDFSTNRPAYGLLVWRQDVRPGS